MPEPPPVMRATLFQSHVPKGDESEESTPLSLFTFLHSRHFEVSPPLPVGDDGVEFSLFGAEEVEVVIDDVFAERLAREGALGQRGDRFVERVRHVRQVGRGL